MNTETQIISNPIIGTIDEFHSKKCFELYMYAVEFAKQINSYLDDGYLVLNKNNEHTELKFVFYGINGPCIAQKSGNCLLVYFGHSIDKEGKVWIQGTTTKKSIKELFSKFKCVKPCNIERIKFKHK